MSLRLHDAGIHGWSRLQADRGYEFSGTAIEAGDGTVLLVDPVPATDEERSALKQLGTRFEIVILNAHHVREAAAFSAAFDAPIHVPRPDAPKIAVAGAQPFDDGHRFPGGWTARTFAGLKTPGESVLHHGGRRLLVVGDAVIADPVTGLRLPPPAMIPDRPAALASLQRLAALDFDGMICADGFTLPRGGREALRRFLAREGFPAT